MIDYLIQQQVELDEVCSRLSEQPIIGVDTEFIRVSTYYPKLCLVQISSEDEIYCLDVLEDGLNLSPLWEVLGSTSVIKVVHAARQDIEALIHTAEVIPRPLFDTQIAASMLGYGEQYRIRWTGGTVV